MARRSSSLSVQAAVDEGCVRLRMGFRGVRTRLFLADLAGRGLLRFFLVRSLLCVGRWRLLGGGKADAAGKYQRERTRRQEMASHGCLLSSGLRERNSMRCANAPLHAYSRGRRPAVGLRRQPPEVRFGFMARAWRNRSPRPRRAPEYAPTPSSHRAPSLPILRGHFDLMT